MAEFYDPMVTIGLCGNDPTATAPKLPSCIENDVLYTINYFVHQSNNASLKTLIKSHFVLDELATAYALCQDYIPNEIKTPHGRNLPRDVKKKSHSEMLDTIIAWLQVKPSRSSPKIHAIDYCNIPPAHLKDVSLIQATNMSKKALDYVNTWEENFEERTLSISQSKLILEELANLSAQIQEMKEILNSSHHGHKSPSQGSGEATALPPAATEGDTSAIFDTPSPTTQPLEMPTHESDLTGDVMGTEGIPLNNDTGPQQSPYPEGNSSNTPLITNQASSPPTPSTPKAATPDPRWVDEDGFQFGHSSQDRKRLSRKASRARGNTHAPPPPQPSPPPHQSSPPPHIQSERSIT